MIQSGLDPQAIANALIEQTRLKAEGTNESQEIFSDKVIIAAQALAYREADVEDAQRITELINLSYDPEVHGPESFREGPTVLISDVQSLILDSSYHWLVVEAPSGRGIESDGAMLGVCCFTTDGVSRKNGIGFLSPFYYLIPSSKGLKREMLDQFVILQYYQVITVLINSIILD
jgi:hypothetical protein